MIPEVKHNDDSDHEALGESTKVRLGLLIAILGLVMTGIVGGVWWAATITAKVNVILEFNNQTKESAKEYAAQIGTLDKLTQRLEMKISVLESRVTAAELKSGTMK